MTHHDNDENLKLKEKFYFNITARNYEKKVKFTKWLAVQSNAQSSLLSLIEHAIDRFGYEDVMDHDIVKKMHTELIHFQNPENAPVILHKPIEDNDKKNVTPDPVATTEDKPKPIEEGKNAKINKSAF